MVRIVQIQRERPNLKRPYPCPSEQKLWCVHRGKSKTLEEEFSRRTTSQAGWNHRCGSTRCRIHRRSREHPSCKQCAVRPASRPDAGSERHRRSAWLPCRAGGRERRGLPQPPAPTGCRPAKGEESPPAAICRWKGLQPAVTFRRYPARQWGRLRLVAALAYSRIPVREKETRLGIGDIFKQGRRRAVYLQTPEVERHAVKRSLTDIYEVAAWQIAPKITAAPNHLDPSRLERKNFDVGAVESGGGSCDHAGEQNVLTAGQNLRPTPGPLAVLLRLADDLRFTPGSQARGTDGNPSRLAMIAPSSPQEAPRSRPAVSHNETTPPPCRGIFFNFWPAKNPIHWPSGEKKGSTAPSVPASIVTVDWSRRRMASCSLPSASLRGENQTCSVRRDYRVEEFTALCPSPDCFGSQVNAEAHHGPIRRPCGAP